MSHYLSYLETVRVVKREQCACVCIYMRACVYMCVCNYDVLPNGRCELAVLVSTYNYSELSSLRVYMCTHSPTLARMCCRALGRAYRLACRWACTYMRTLTFILSHALLHFPARAPHVHARAYGPARMWGCTYMRALTSIFSHAPTVTDTRSTCIRMRM